MVKPILTSRLKPHLRLTLFIRVSSKFLSQRAELQTSSADLGIYLQTSNDVMKVVKSLKSAKKQASRLQSG